MYKIPVLKALVAFLFFISIASITSSKEPDAIEVSLEYLLGNLETWGSWFDPTNDVGLIPEAEGRFVPSTAPLTQVGGTIPSGIGVVGFAQPIVVSQSGIPKGFDENDRLHEYEPLPINYNDSIEDVFQKVSYLDRLTYQYGVQISGRIVQIYRKPIEKEFTLLSLLQRMGASPEIAEVWVTEYAKVAHLPQTIQLAWLISDNPLAEDYQAHVEHLLTGLDWNALLIANPRVGETSSIQTSGSLLANQDPFWAEVQKQPLIVAFTELLSDASEDVKRSFIVSLFFSEPILPVARETNPVVVSGIDSRSQPFSSSDRGITVSENNNKPTILNTGPTNPILSAKEVGHQLINMYREGKTHIEVVQKLYSNNVVSIEAVQGSGPAREISGMDAVIDKAKWWANNNVVHNAEYRGPYPHGDNKFAVFFNLDLTNKQMNNTRLQLEEVAVYEVSKGKVVREEYFYNVDAVGTNSTLDAKAVGTELVSMYREGKTHIEVVQKLFSNNVVSVEAIQGSGPAREISGMDAVIDKAKWWANNNVVHSAEYKGPYPHGDNKFALFFNLDLTNKQMNNTRLQLEEVAVYEVSEGKVVHEEYFYNVDAPNTSERLENAMNLYLEGIRDGKIREAVTKYTGARYTQHSTGVRDGAEGFIEFFEPFIERNPKRDIQIVRAIEDGQYVFLHVYQSLNDGEAKWVTTDFFDTDENSKIIEHWDVIAEYTPETPSGHTSIDGITAITDLGKTEQNKQLVRDLMNDALIGKNFENIGKYISSEKYIQHNAKAPDGLEHFETLLLGQDKALVYEEVVLLVGQGNFVATLCKVSQKGQPFAQVDIFRIEGSKIVEHWGNAEPVPPKEEWANSGKF